MSIFKCKMCGGDLDITAGVTVCECEYCGTRQTVPAADNEKKMTFFSRANRLLRGCEFDKAAGVFESIVVDFPEEAEAYWGLVLCKYGIEYVDDPATGRKVPTCHRSSFDSVMDDANFEQACENADSAARKVYREEAKAIEELRKGIIEVSGKEEPYDIFICYKETADNGERTLDSVLAQDVYDALTEKGYRVFFSRVTLEDKLGQEYEPYIFAALNSAKVMLAFGTDYDYYNAVWVKNEWSRFLQLIAKGEKKTLIPCYKGIDAYDLPKEFAKLQAQDLGKVGAMQDLLRGIEKILPRETTAAKETVIVNGGQNNVAPLLERAFMFLEDSEWAKADDFCEQVLNHDPKNAQAYLGKLMAELQVSKREDLSLCETQFEDNQNYIKALRFADSGLKKQLEQYVTDFKAAAEEKEQLAIATEAERLLQTGKKADAVKAKELFQSLKNESNRTDGLAKCETVLEDIERKDNANKAAAAKRAKHCKKLGIAAAAIIAVILVVTQVILPANASKKVKELLTAGEYQAAYEMLQKSSKDTETLDRCRYQWANAVFSDDEERAVELYREIEEAKNLTEEDLAQGYDNAFALLDKHDPKNAQVLFKLLGDYESSSQYAEYCTAYIEASEGTITDAVNKYSKLPKDFLDVDARIKFIKEFWKFTSVSAYPGDGISLESDAVLCCYTCLLSTEGLHLIYNLEMDAVGNGPQAAATITDFATCIKDGCIKTTDPNTHTSGFTIYKDRIVLPDDYDGSEHVLYFK